MDWAGNVVKQYAYDAFGNEEEVSANAADDTGSADSAAVAIDTNPFRYCGEEYDTGLSQLNLRARWYTLSLGRFTSEDPAKDGTNWYVYCANDPVNFKDPTGLFTEGDVLGYGSSGDDVAVLQNELAWLGYVGRDGKPLTADGIFGENTAYAVRQYQRDRGLAVDGLVGNNTWKSMGLLAITRADAQKGVKVVTIGLKQYMDVSIPVNNAVWNARAEFQKHKGNVFWFMDQVDDQKPWDIKVAKSWADTIGTTFPGSYDSPIIFFGDIVTPETLGNITYGYLGSAAGFTLDILLIGGDYAAGGIEGIFTRADTEEDKANIKRGVQWYNG